MKRITIVARKSDKNYGYGFSIPKTMNEQELIKVVFKGYEIVKMTLKEI